MKQWMMIFCLMMTLAACNLNSSDEASEPLNTATANAPVTEQASTPEAVATHTPAPATNNTPVTLDCQLRPDWFTYTVVQGDTLSEIARLTGSTVNMLVEGNCLTNPNSITPGQQLLVPRPPADVATVNRMLTISPILENRGGTMMVQAGTTVTITWAGVPENSLVSFIEGNFLVDGGARTIGDDISDGSGASITYVVPNEINGQITASARLPGQNHEIIESNALSIQTVGYSDGDCRYVAPPLGGPHLVYNSADSSSTVLGEAVQEIEYVVTARLNGVLDGKTREFLQINFNGQTGYVPENNVQLRGNCENLP